MSQTSGAASLPGADVAGQTLLGAGTVAAISAVLVTVLIALAVFVVLAIAGFAMT